MGRGRRLAEFQREFPDEASCGTFLSARRWRDGLVCPACGGGRAVALKSRPRLLECLDCGRQTSLTAGTAMHRSKLPLTTWFWAAHLMATHSNGMSARQLEDQLGVTYKTAWLLAQKLRRSMVDPGRDLLESVVEVDQTEIPFRAGDAFFEPGSAGKILVVGAVEVIDRDTGRPKPRRRGAKYLDTRSGRLRLAVIADNSAKSIEAFVRADVKPGATLITDGHAAYPGLSGDYRHDPRVVGTMAGHVVLPWSHRAFSLLKRWAGAIQSDAAMLSIRESREAWHMAAAKLSDEAFSAILEAHPGLRERFASIAMAVANSGENLKEADAIEERIVEEMRLLGREAMQGWAETQVKATEKEIRQQSSMHRQGKKNSAGIRNLAKSRF